MTKLQAHRGVQTECPENTMPAFDLAIEQGYAAIELDPIVTKDLHVVLHHDNTINRTGRMADGSPIREELRVDQLTLNELNAYDFGLHKHPKFRGLKLPLLADLLPKARKAGVQLKIDAKIFKMTAEHQQVLFDLIRDWQDICALSTKNVEQTLRAHALFPHMQVHYGGPCVEDKLQELAAAIPEDKLNIWLPYPNERTAYAYANLPGFREDLIQVPVLTPERARLARRYGKIGVWNLGDERELDEVRTLGVYMAETNGEVKPVRNRGVLSDMHTHSSHSMDCSIPMGDMYAACRSQGIAIMAATDHYNGLFTADGDYDYAHIVASCKEADELSALHPDGQVLRGIELGEGHWDPAQTAQVLSAGDYDVVIGSVHAVQSPLFADRKGMDRAFSRLDYENFTARQTHELLTAYYRDNLTMVRTVDMDVCAHLTCAVRYFMTRHGIYVSVEQFRDQIEAILKVMIEKGIALEVNFTTWPDSGITSPHLWIIELYRRLGGYLITLASDSHRPATFGKGMHEGLQLLKNMGFRHIFYYKDRKPIQCTLA